MTIYFNQIITQLLTEQTNLLVAVNYYRFITYTCIATALVDRLTLQNKVIKKPKENHDFQKSYVSCILASSYSCILHGVSSFRLQPGNHKYINLIASVFRMLYRLVIELINMLPRWQMTTKN